MTLKSLFKRPETIRYPYETKPPVEDLKGHVENDIVECTLCGICAKRCPTSLHVRKRKKLLELRRRWKRKLHVKKPSRNKLAKRLKLRLPI